MSNGIVTDLSAEAHWQIASGYINTFTINALSEGGAFSLEDRAFSIQIREIGSESNLIELTEGDGIINGGLDGILTITISAARSSTLGNNQYFWQLTCITDSTRWLNGPITANTRTYDGGAATNDLTAEISLTPMSVTLEITLGGAGSEWGDIGGDIIDQVDLVNYVSAITITANAYSDSLVVTTEASGTVITLDSLLKEYSDITLSGGNVSLTVAGSGHVLGRSAWRKVVADGVHTLTFSGSGWLVIRNFTSGSIPAAGTYWVFFFYTTGGVQVNWPDTPPTASTVAFTPAGNIAATTVQAAIQELDTEKVPTTRTVNGQALSGDIVIPSQYYYTPTNSLYISNNRGGAATASVGFTVNLEFASRWIVGKTLTVSQMALEVTSFSGSQNARLGIRDSTGALVTNSDIGNFSLGSNGVVRQSFSQNIILTPGIYYLVYISSSSSPVCRGWGADALETIGISEIGSNCSLTRYSINRGSFGSLGPSFDFAAAVKANAGVVIQVLTLV